MFLLYLDASGTPDIPGDRPIYVVHGICVHETTWFTVENQIRSLKKAYAVANEDFELHSKDFCCSIREQDEIPNFASLDLLARRHAVRKLRREKLSTATGTKLKNSTKRFKETDSFVHLTRSERSKLFEDVLDLVGSQDGIRLFCEAINKQDLNKLTSDDNALRTGFTQVVTRFDAFLQYYNSARSDPSDNGLLVMDNEPTYEEQLRKLLESYRTIGHPFGSLRHVIETPFFVDSKTSPLIQVADICSYAVRRYLESDVTKPSFEEANLQRIFHRYDRAGPKLHGIRHYCQRGSCQCVICVARRHHNT